MRREFSLKATPLHILPLSFCVLLSDEEYTKQMLRALMDVLAYSERCLESWHARRIGFGSEQLKPKLQTRGCVVSHNNTQIT